jgi:rhodanese-related sulfurtransferase
MAAGDEATSTDDKTHTDLTVAQFQALIEEDDFPLVNVHIPFEGNIPGTDLNIPFDDIPAHLDQLPVDKDARIVLYCKTNGMSLIAIEELSALGYTNLFNIDGGFTAWQEAGLPLEGG